MKYILVWLLFIPTGLCAELIVDPVGDKVVGSTFTATEFNVWKNTTVYVLNGHIEADNITNGSITSDDIRGRAVLPQHFDTSADYTFPNITSNLLITNAIDVTSLDTIVENYVLISSQTSGTYYLDPLDISEYDEYLICIDVRFDNTTQTTGATRPYTCDFLINSTAGSAIAITSTTLVSTNLYGLCRNTRNIRGLNLGYIVGRLIKLNSRTVLILTEARTNQRTTGSSYGFWFHGASIYTITSDISTITIQEGGGCTSNRFYYYLYGVTK